jgi:acetoacetate decarboxylase
MRAGEVRETAYQVIPVRLGNENGGCSRAMYLNDGPPISIRRAA